MITVFENVSSPSPVCLIKPEVALTLLYSRVTFTPNVEKARKLKSDGDKEGYVALKKKIPVITWAGAFSYRSSAGLVSLSDYMYFDVDGSIQKEDFFQFPFVKAAWVSVGGNGTAALVYCKGLTLNNYKSTYNSLAAFFKEADIITDTISDPTRCNIFSHDPNLLIREECEFYRAVEPPVVDHSAYLNNTNFKYSQITSTKTSEDLCKIALTLAYKKGLSFVEGQRHNFTMSFFGTCNLYGVPLNEAYNFLACCGYVSSHTYGKAQKVYNAYFAKHGTFTWHFH